MKPKRDAQFSFRIRPDLLASIRRVAEEHDRSAAWVVARCVEVGLPAVEREGRPSAVKPREGKG